MAKPIPTWDETTPVEKKAPSSSVPKFEETTEITPSWNDTVPVEKESQAGAAVSGAAKGASLGFADELAGAIGGAYDYISQGGKLSYGDYYKIRRDLARAQDEKRAEAFPKTTLASEIAGGLLLPAGNVARGASLGTKVKTGAALGAATGLGYSDEESLSGMAKDAAVGAGVGGAIPVVFEKAISPAAKAIAAKVFKPKGLDALAKNPLDKAARRAFEEGADEMEGAAIATSDFLEQLDPLFNKIDEIKGLPPRLSKDFKERFVKQAGGPVEDLSTKQLNTAYAEATKRFKPEYVLDTFKEYEKGKVMRAAARKNIARVSDKLGLKSQPTTGLSGYVQDPKYAARSADRLLNTGLSKKLDRLSEVEGESIFVTNKYLKPLEVLSEKRQAAGIDNKELGRALNGDKAVREKLLSTPEGAEIYQGYRDLFDATADKLREMGHDIGQLDDYLPMKVVKGDEFATSIRKQYEKMQAGELGQDELDDFLSSIMRINNTPGKKSITGSDVQMAIRNILNKDSAGGDLAGVGSAFERTGKVPDFIRQWGADESLFQYISHNLRSAFIQKPLREISQSADALADAGLDKTSQYFHDLVEHQLKNSSKLKLDVMADKYRYGVEKMLESGSFGPVSKDLMKGVPKLGGILNTVYYGAVLGGSPSSFARNMTQATMVTAPEIGGLYGQKLLTGGYASLVKDLKKGLPLEKILKAKGLSGGVIREMSDNKGATNVLEKGARKTTDAMMYLYSLSDTLNRYATLKASDQMAKDAFSGGVKAKEALMRWAKKDPAYGVAFKKAKTPEELSKEIASYLISTTQFHYGKTQLHKAGREFGQLFSMFTKWPTNRGSDIAESFQALGAKEGMKDFTSRYLAPLGAVSGLWFGADKVLDEDSKINQTKRYLFRDPTSLSPASSALSFSLDTNPIGRGLLGAGRSISDFTKEDDFKKALEKRAKASGKTVLEYGLPGYSSVLNELKRVDKAFDTKYSGTISPLHKKEKGNR